MESFSRKTAVITGAGSGLGLALARALANEGARLVLADINADDLAAAESSLRAAGADCTSCVTDVAWGRSVDALAERAQTHYGRVHLLFNNAGVAVSAPVWESSEADWQWLIGVNLMGIVHGIRSFVPHMIAHGSGVIVNNGSDWAVVGGQDAAAYCASKGASLPACSRAERSSNPPT